VINFKIFDPHDVNKRIISVPVASFRLSILGLLSKRIVISHAILNDAEVSLEGRPDGSFNIQDIAKRSETKPIDIETLKKKDVFGHIYGAVKDRLSKEQLEQAKQKKKEEKEVSKTIEDLPRGKYVHFKTTKHILKIADLDFDKATVSFKSAEGNNMEITQAKIKLKDFGVDPELGMQVGSFLVNATLSKDGAKLGGVSAKGAVRYVNDALHLNFDIQFKEVDLKPLEFIYRDSLPVEIQKGIIDLNSKTTLSYGNLNSHNNLHLKDYFLSPKENNEVITGFMPMNIVCTALNRLNGIDLDFDITGTPEHPEFKGLQESLNKLIKPVLNEIGEGIKEQGFKVLEDFLRKKVKIDLPQSDTSQEPDTSQDKEGQTINPVDILKTILGGKENSK
jgi:hypothetical protein